MGGNSMEQRYLWQFEWYVRRGGSVEGLFVATESKVKSIIGQYVYFGEILGKHSEVYGTINEGDITKVDIDSETVEKVTAILGRTWNGYNPIDYIRPTCNQCGNRCHQDEMYDDEICGECAYEIEEEVKRALEEGEE
jgi:hypothetical protein